MSIVHRPASGVFYTALTLAREGLPIFPCRDDKRPACPHGFKSAVADQARLIDLWQKYPGTLIGMPTGKVSGFDVIDIDPRHGGDRWLEAEIPRLPMTRKHHTRSGGLHIFYRHHDGIRNSAGRIAPGVDVRGTGGYVVWWPAEGLPIENRDVLAPWPDWLLIRLLPSVSRPPVAKIATVAGIRRAHSTYAEAALSHAATAIAHTPPGARNAVLNREAFSLSRFVLSGALCPQKIAKVLFMAGLAAGLPEQEVRKTLKSAFHAGGIS